MYHRWIQKEDESFVYGLVTRYGPWTSLLAQEVISESNNPTSAIWLVVESRKATLEYETR